MLTVEEHATSVVGFEKTGPMFSKTGRIRFIKNSLIFGVTRKPQEPFLD